MSLSTQVFNLILEKYYLSVAPVKSITRKESLFNIIVLLTAKSTLISKLKKKLQNRCKATKHMTRQSHSQR